MDKTHENHHAASPGTVQVAPSLICTDLCNLERSIKQLESLGLDCLHVDILDGHFSPSMPIGIDVVRQLREKTSLAFDVHLMVTENEFFVQEMARIGAQRICFHIESAFHADRLLTVIKDQGIQAGIALMPATPLTALDYVLHRCDFLLLMLINPGYAGHRGEQQVPYALRKVAESKRYLSQQGVDIPLEVDGCVSFENIPDLVAAGADILVAGTSCLFHASDAVTKNLTRMTQAIAEGLKKRKP